MPGYSLPSTPEQALHPNPARGIYLPFNPTNTDWYPTVPANVVGDVKKSICVLTEPMFQRGRCTSKPPSKHKTEELTAPT